MKKSLALIISVLFTLPIFDVHASAAAPTVKFSHEAGLYESAFSLTLTADNSNTKIYYTLDGSEPIPAEVGGGVTYLYSQPLELKDRTSEANKLSSQKTSWYGSFWSAPTVKVPKCTMLWVKAVNAAEEKDYCKSYIITNGIFEKYNLPVISIIGSEEVFFNHYDGLFPEEWWFNHMVPDAPSNPDRAVHVEFFDMAGKPVISQHISVRLHGGYSKHFAQKTLRLYARKENDPDNKDFDYPVFPGLKTADGRNISKYKRLLLRNGGNDFYQTMFRDVLVHKATEKLSFDVQAAAPAVLYLGGEFWGLVNIRERIDNEYLASHYPVEKDGVALLSVGGATPELEEGTTTDTSDFTALRNYINNNNNDMSKDNHYEYVAERMDIENCIDYYAAQTYIANMDWQTNNMRIWRYKSGNIENTTPGRDGRWRWMMFDADLSFGVTHPDKNQNSEDPNYDMLEYVLEQSDANSAVLKNLLENDTFKSEFIARYTNMINTAFNPARVNKLYTEYKDLITAAMPYQIDRYKGISSIAQWNLNCKVMSDYADNRPEPVLDQLRDRFGLGERHEIKIENNSPLKISVNGYPLDEYDLINGEWKGSYFVETPVEIKIESEDGAEYTLEEVRNGNAESISDQVISIIPSEDVIIRVKDYNDPPATETLIPATDTLTPESTDTPVPTLTPDVTSETEVITPVTETPVVTETLTPETAPPANKVKNHKTNKKTIMYKKAKVKSTVIRKIPKNKKVNRVGSSGKFYKVKFSGKTGFLKKTDITATGKWYFIVKKSVVSRKKPSEKAGKSTTFDKGAKPVFSKMQYDGKKNWYCVSGTNKWIPKNRLVRYG